MLSLNVLFLVSLCSIVMAITIARDDRESFHHVHVRESHTARQLGEPSHLMCQTQVMETRLWHPQT